MNQPSFYWYDLETSGIESRWDRIVQFAGLRTDMDLNPVGDEYCAYVRLADDVLPSPGAAMVTGLEAVVSTSPPAVCPTPELPTTSTVSAPALVT